MYYIPTYYFFNIIISNPLTLIYLSNNQSLYLFLTNRLENCTPSTTKIKKEYATGAYSLFTYLQSFCNGRITWHTSRTLTFRTTKSIFYLPVLFLIIFKYHVFIHINKILWCYIYSKIR